MLLQQEYISRDYKTDPRSIVQAGEPGSGLPIVFFEARNLKAQSISSSNTPEYLK